MIGRDSALGTLLAEFALAASGDPRIVILGGEAGIGKSRLIDEFRDRLPADAVLVTGQCVEHGAVALPYAPLSGVFRGLAEEYGVDAVAAVSGNRALSSGHDRDERTGIDRLDEAVTALWEQLSAERPLVVVIEDVHWADPATLDVLRFAARQLWSGRLLILLSYRTDDVGRGHPLRPFLAELERSKRVTRVALDRLSIAEVREQASAILGNAPSAERVAQLHERSEGVPFFVEELLGIGATGGGSAVPETLRELLLARYEGLEDDAREVVRLLAAGGARVSHEILTEGSPFAPAALETALRAAVDAGVIVVEGPGYDFRHALVREAVHDELLPGESIRFHTAYALALENREVDSARAAAKAVLVSFHWMEAHDQERAFAASLTGMWLSQAAFAYAGAAQLGERALSLWNSVADPESVGVDHITLLERTAMAWRSAGEAHRAMSMIDQAIAEAHDADPATRARLLRDKGLMMSVDLRAEAVTALEAALALVSDGSDEMLRTNILAELASHYMINGRTDDAMRATTAVLDEADPAWTRSRSIAANIRGGTLLHAGRVEEGLADFEDARRSAGDDRDPLLRYYVNLSDSYHLLGRFEESLATATEGLEMSRQAGVERTSGAILAVNTIDPLFSLGRWAEADELIDRSLELDPPPVFRVYLRRAKIRSLVWSGAPDRARTLWDTWAPSMSRLGEFESQTRAGVALDVAELMMALGDVEAAWAFARTIVEDERIASAGWELPLAGAAAHVLAARRARTGTSTAFAEEHRRLEDVLERDAHWPTQPFWALLVAAELGGEAGTGTDVDAWLRARDAAAAPQIAVLERLKVEHGLARAQIASGDRAGATETLTALDASARALGAGLLVKWADELLERAGLGDREHASGDDALTAREQQVLELVAEGLSNGQIAERLYISRKTVSVHVSAILRKTGAASRTEAVRLAAR